MYDSDTGFIIWGILVIVITYPISLILISLGYINPTDNGSRIARIFNMANLILRNQLFLMFYGFLWSCVGAVILTIPWLIGFTILQNIGVSSFEQDSLGIPYMIVLLMLHTVVQGFAYREAIKFTIIDRLDQSQN